MKRVARHIVVMINKWANDGDGDFMSACKIHW
jgi:hypothetical protein